MWTILKSTPAALCAAYHTHHQVFEACLHDDPPWYFMMEKLVCFYFQLLYGSNHLDLVVATTSCCNDDQAKSWPSSSGLRGRRRTNHTILKLADHALFKMVRYVFLRPLRPELDGQYFT
jgi:hypothetical protein